MFAKIFTQILDSSLAENFEVRHVFEDLLKLCDVNGVVDMTRESIARRLNVPIETVTRAIDQLEKPDPSSRTPDNEGRRIVRLDEHRDWGWFITNHQYYRNLASEEQRRERTRQRVQRFRKGGCNAPVTQGNACNAMQKQKQKQKQKEKTYTSASRTVLFYLNESTGKSFRETATNLSRIDARLEEPGVTLEGVKQMIDRQCKRWKGTAMAEYLRPQTLFGKEKFDGYYAAKDQPVSTNSGEGVDRNKGTLNEGNAGQYNLSKIQAAESVQDVW